MQEKLLESHDRRISALEKNQRWSVILLSLLVGLTASEHPIILKLIGA